MELHCLQLVVVCMHSCAAAVQRRANAAAICRSAGRQSTLMASPSAQLLIAPAGRTCCSTSSSDSAAPPRTPSWCRDASRWAMKPPGGVGARASSSPALLWRSQGSLPPRDGASAACLPFNTTACGPCARAPGMCVKGCLPACGMYSYGRRRAQSMSHTGSLFCAEFESPRRAESQRLVPGARRTVAGGCMGHHADAGGCPDLGRPVARPCGHSSGRWGRQRELCFDAAQHVLARAAQDQVRCEYLQHARHTTASQSTRTRQVALALHPDMQGRVWRSAQPLSKVRAQAEINVCMCSRPGSGACRMQSRPGFIRSGLGYAPGGWQRPGTASPARAGAGRQRGTGRRPSDNGSARRLRTPSQSLSKPVSVYSSMLTCRGMK